MSMIKSYAAKEAGGELEVYEYDPGELKPQDVEVQVDYCGICHSDLSMGRSACRDWLDGA